MKYVCTFCVNAKYFDEFIAGKNGSGPADVIKLTPLILDPLTNGAAGLIGVGFTSMQTFLN